MDRRPTTRTLRNRFMLRRSLVGSRACSGRRSELVGSTLPLRDVEKQPLRGLRLRWRRRLGRSWRQPTIGSATSTSDRLRRMRRRRRSVPLRGRFTELRRVTSLRGWNTPAKCQVGRRARAVAGDHAPALPVGPAATALSGGRLTYRLIDPLVRDEEEPYGSSHVTTVTVLTAGQVTL